MARNYSTRDFFRQMPNALLARYFHSRGMFLELNFEAMKEGRPEELINAWAGLPVDQQAEMEAEFREIQEMSGEKGFIAILDEARWHLEARPDELKKFVDTLSALPDHWSRAMVALLDYPECWKGATLFHHADRLPYWRKRKNLPSVTAAVDQGSLDALGELVKGYFRFAEGRGRNCVVEPYRRGDRDYFFAFPEDHAQRSVEWVDGEFNSRPHNPAFEIVFVYSQREGTLDLNFRGSPKAIAALQGIFAQAILKLDELPPDPKDNRVYELGPLLRPGFRFSHEPGSGIVAVVVKKLRLSSRSRPGDRITVEADSFRDRDAIYVLMDQIGKAVPLQQYNVTQVELAAAVQIDASRPPKTVPIRITHPNSCSLKYDEVGLRLRQMLASSGIEPRAPAPVG